VTSRSGAAAVTGSPVDIAVQAAARFGGPDVRARQVSLRPHSVEDRHELGDRFVHDFDADGAVGHAAPEDRLHVLLPALVDGGLPACVFAVMRGQRPEVQPEHPVLPGAR